MNEHERTNDNTPVTDDNPPADSERRTRQPGKWHLVTSNEEFTKVEVVICDTKKEFLQIANETKDNIELAFYGKIVELKRKELYDIG